jgi:hypothetical protein
MMFPDIDASECRRLQNKMKALVCVPGMGALAYRNGCHKS